MSSSISPASPLPAALPLPAVEQLKATNSTLAGTIATALADAGLDHFTDDDALFLKFHGIYQQDDRDLRKTGRKYIMMVRVRMPAGLLQPDQYLALDRLATDFANNTLRVTSRQAIQFHGVLKSNLAPVIKGIHETLLTTLAACGDVVRNVMAPVAPVAGPVLARVQAEARRISQALCPATPAYPEIWLNGRQLDLSAPANANFADAFYGKTYLPRKFKIALAIPPYNDVDLFAHCAGLIAIVEGDRLAGYNLTAGGGMGRSHGNAATFPRCADVIGFITPDQVVPALTTVVTIHRDFGDRTNRKHARLKYVLAERGVEWFRGELERRLGAKLAPAKPFQFTHQGDPFGWHPQSGGRWCLGLFTETGRIKDQPPRLLKTALRRVVEQYRPELRLTPGNNVLLVNLAAGDRAAITQLFSDHGVAVDRQGSPTRLASMACVALPTCGLALAESERFLPGWVTDLEALLAEVGLAGEEITVRMTGCPNGCARPYLAEIGLVGRAPLKYQVYLGGHPVGLRINQLYRDQVKASDLVSELRPVLSRFAKERMAGERFGDWCQRVLLPESQPATAP